MSATRFVRPAALDEALSALASAEDEGVFARAISGGTALMLLTKTGFFDPELLVSLQRLQPALTRIERRGERLHVGALCRLAPLARAPEVRALPALCTALSGIANPRVRNVATIGGHLAHGDPHMDLPPVLSALSAEAVVTGTAGERRVPVIELITGYYETTLAATELITAVEIPIPATGTRGTYVRFTGRSADDWPVLGVAVVGRLEAGRIAEVAVGLGGVVTRPTRLVAVEELLRGSEPTAAALEAAAQAGSEGLAPTPDQHGSADYKAEMVRVHLRRAVQQVFSEEVDDGAS